MSNNNTNLKRTRSTESLEMAFKRARPFHVTDSPASVSSEPILSTIHHPFSPPTTTTTTTTTHQLASTTTQQTSNIVYPTSSSSPTLLETISISTKSATDSNIPPSSPYATYQPPLPDYSHVNGILHSLHVQRFGDPESRESWWEQAQQQQQQEEDQDIDMEETNDEYATANSILRQAFLQRRH